MRIFWPAMAEDLVELQFSSQWSRERRFAAYPPGSTNETNAVEGGKRQTRQHRPFRKEIANA